MKSLNELIGRYPVLACCRQDMETVFRDLMGVFSSGGKVLVCGNGGSAADADHWSAELLKAFVKKRPLPEADVERLGPALSGNLQRGLPCIPLAGFVALNSAYANDCDAEYAYAQLTYALGSPSDALIGISTSGNARNVCHALSVARAMGMNTIGLSGQSGGAMKPLCDVCICVPCTETYLVQELHLPVYHTLSIMLEESLC
ncbi:MAG: SIS domain-containing protein [Kiritimatiellae bacterium]|nr:SIS domain-containing protein [Kiritimatiellia bacterium]MDD4736666.1 SIS domain-containing protein [Kiritimatiellia bacterium]